jgi:hypothetical protein
MTWLVIGLLIVISLLLFKIYERSGAIWVQLDHLNSHLNSGITDLAERLERISRPGGGTT